MRKHLSAIRLTGCSKKRCGVLFKVEAVNSPFINWLTDSDLCTLLPMFPLYLSLTLTYLLLAGSMNLLAILLGLPLPLGISTTAHTLTHCLSPTLPIQYR